MDLFSNFYINLLTAPKTKSTFLMYSAFIVMLHVLNDISTSIATPYAAYLSNSIDESLSFIFILIETWANSPIRKRKMN